MTTSALRACLFVLALALPAAAAAQAIPPVGADRTLDVATWNIEWFGSTGNGPSDENGQLARVRDVIAASDVDLWALQEIADADAFDALLAALGDAYGGILATQSGQQRIAFVYRTETIHHRRAEHILTTLDFAGRPPLQLEADVLLPDTTFTAKFVVVHMKAFDDRDSYLRRVEGARRLKARFDVFEQTTPLLLLGDFNDEMRASIYLSQPSPYAPFVEDAADYTVLTLPLEEANRASWCGNSSTCAGGSTIDHIIATDELAAAYVDGSADRYEALLTAIPSYVYNTSDHLPVVARFDFSTTTDVEVPSAARASAAPYPNPFGEMLTVPYTLPQPGAVTIAVYDLLGRPVMEETKAAAPAGSYEVTLRFATAAPPGVYLVQVTAGGTRTTHRVVRMP